MQSKPNKYSRIYNNEKNEQKWEKKIREKGTLKQLNKMLFALVTNDYQLNTITK